MIIFALVMGIVFLALGFVGFVTDGESHAKDMICGHVWLTTAFILISIENKTFRKGGLRD